jgi:hypothetical protein
MSLKHMVFDVFDPKAVEVVSNFLQSRLIFLGQGHCEGATIIRAHPIGTLRSYEP